MKTINKRLQSTKEYIDALQAKHSKLNIVRVDLAYKKPFSNDIDLDDANKDLNRLLNNRRSKPSIFENQVGYIAKKEFTEDKGVHIHAVFIYDGNKVKKDAYKADQIGEYWRDNITSEKGSYHSCHRTKYPKNGLGMLEHNDKEKREVLDKNVLSYLCKETQSIDEIKTNKQDRAFTRGTLPKKKSNAGRPRNA